MRFWFILLLAVCSFAGYGQAIPFGTGINYVNAFDPYNMYVTFSLSNNNLTASCPEPSGTNGMVRTVNSHNGTNAYCEITMNNSVSTGANIGIVNGTANTAEELGFTANSYGYVTFSSGGYSFHSNSATAVTDYYSAGDVISIAYHGSVNAFSVYRNGNAVAEFTFTGLAAVAWYAAVSNYTGTLSATPSYTLNTDGSTNGAWDSRTATLRGTLGAAGYTIGW